MPTLTIHHNTAAQIKSISGIFSREPNSTRLECMCAFTTMM